jgi:hypothetical protein
MLKNYRGKILFFDLMGWGVVGLCLFIIMMVGIGVSRSQNGNWGSFIITLIVFLIIVPIVYKATKCYQCKYLRQAHFMLAIVCRSENNRYYLKRGVEVRPGYLGKWIEFNVIKEGERDIVSYVLDRHKQTMDQNQKNAEADHMRFLDGVNRNLNTQAIELRIQIEEAKNQRPLTDGEKQEIINA